jgi:hypothetical protein
MGLSNYFFNGVKSAWGKLNRRSPFGSVKGSASRVARSWGKFYRPWSRKGCDWLNELYKGLSSKKKESYVSSFIVPEESWWPEPKTFEPLASARDQPV